MQYERVNVLFFHQSADCVRYTRRRREDVHQAGHVALMASNEDGGWRTADRGQRAEDSVRRASRGRQIEDGR
jgi:hypothetical protein